jgi:diguanylate cyclase (GGDEF)-like protein
MGGKALYDQSFAALLLQERAEQLKRIRVEIDLYVDRLQAQVRKSVTVPGKERDQKFGILLSPKQAGLDFDEWKGRLKAGASIAVLFLDIDNFKEQNTRHTETVVDKALLPEVQLLLAALVDQRGAAYRHGGDEFVLLLPNHDKDEALAFAEKVRSRIASQKFQVGEQTESLTISGGVALWSEHGSKYDDVLANANLAKRKAKEQRNAIIIFS